MKKRVIASLLALFLAAGESTLPVLAAPLDFAAEQTEARQAAEQEPADDAADELTDGRETDAPSSVIQEEGAEESPSATEAFQEEAKEETDTEEEQQEETLSATDTSKKASSTRAASYKAGGECGNDLRWSLDYDGNLLIYGEGEMTHYGFWDYRSPGWKEYSPEIKTLTIEKGATTIGRSAFSGCANLKTVKLPSTMKIIDSDAFYECTSLSSINLPKSVRELGSSTFSKCASLTSITLPEKLENLGDRGYGLSTFSGSGLREITIPASVKKMSGYCFEGCQNLTKATISGTDLTIGYQSFINCANLKTVTMKSGIIALRADAFRNCTSLSMISLNSGLTEIAGSAFQNCTALKEITIPDKVTTLGADIFKDCTFLEKATLGVGLNEIGKTAFLNCTALKEIRFCGAAPAFAGNDTFSGCGSITGYYPADSKTWDRSVLTSHGAERIDWETWNPPLSHFTPVLKSITNIGKGVKLTWEKLGSASGYEIYRKTGNGSFSKVKTINSGNTKSWTDTNVKNGKRYTWRIRGISSAKVQSKVSNSLFLYYLTGTSLRVSSKAGKLTAKWKRNTQASGYQIQYSLKKNFTQPRSTYANKSRRIQTTISLIRGKTYYVRIRPYKTVNGNTFYGFWSGAKKHTVR